MPRHLFILLASLLTFSSLFSQTLVAWDSTFSTDGLTTIDPSTGTIFAGVAPLPSGRIICAGAHGGMHRIYSLDSAGNPDIGFAGPDYFTTPGFSGQSDARYLEVDGTGKLVTAGTWKPSTSADEKLLIMRHHEDGTPDSSFFGTGHLIDAFGLGTKLLPTGLSVHPNADSGMAVSFKGGGPYWILRLNSNGLADSTFGINGIWGTNDFITSLHLLPDGSVAFCGLNSLLHGFVGRLLPGGVPDSSFGVFGLADLHPTDSSSKSVIHCLLPLPGGALLAGGYFHDTLTDIRRMMVVKLKYDGSLDSTFGSAGYLIPELGDSLATSALCLAAMPDGMVAAAGQGYRPPFIIGWSLVLFDTTGLQDTSAWDAGRMLVGVPSLYEETRMGMAATAQSDGRLLVASTASQSHFVMTVMRFLTDMHILLSQEDFQPVQASVRVYPNPVRDYLSIALPHTVLPSEFSLCDMAGRQLHTWLRQSWHQEGDEVLLTLPDGLPKGFYLLKVTSSSGDACVRIQVE